MLTFQSLTDATVSTPAVLSALYARLPANGSELVIFDLNRAARVEPFVNPGAAALLDRILPPAPRPWRGTVVTNASRDGTAAEARTTEPGGTEERAEPLGLDWPREFYSLSHVALPFPLQDGLYGLRPDPADDIGVQLGVLAPRGERGVLVIGVEGLMRASSNPFFPFLLGRVDAGIGGR